MIADDAPNPITQRVTSVLVENPDHHDRLLRKIAGRGPRGDDSAIRDYLRGAVAGGDPWLLGALGDGDLDEVDPCYVATFLRRYSRPVTE